MYVSWILPRPKIWKVRNSAESNLSPNYYFFDIPLIMGGRNNSYIWPEVPLSRPKGNKGISNFWAITINSLRKEALFEYRSGHDNWMMRFHFCTFMALYNHWIGRLCDQQDLLLLSSS